jgi:malonyl CoA-acyl carrier protein transacylase
MVAFVFPGQGSQSRGMAGTLFDLGSYRALEADVDAFLGYSMRGLCLDNPENRLQETQFTQPAVFVANALSYYKALEEGIRPTHVAGHSLGEYDALLAAGSFDFMTGLRLVHKRGELMAAAKNGGMHGVIGLTSEKIAAVMKEVGTPGIDIANYNSPSQIVISGPADELARLGQALDQAGAALRVPLRVSAAFHSRYMAAAATAFAQFLQPFSFAMPAIPVISNVTAQPYSADEQSIKALLIRQITEPVRWDECARYLLANGVDEIREIGPGKVLTGLVREIRQSMPR